MAGGQQIQALFGLVGKSVTVQLQSRKTSGGPPSPTPTPSPPTILALTGVQISASAGSVTASSPSPSPTPPPISTEVWGQKWDYQAAIWSQKRRDRVTNVPFMMHTIAANNTFYQGARNQLPGYRPADNRIWFAVGNQRCWHNGTGVDGFNDNSSESGGHNIASFSVTNPLEVCREGGRPVDPNGEYSAAINTWKGHDPVHDRFMYYGASSFGYEFNEASPPETMPEVITPVTFVNATTARFAAPTLRTLVT